jgi:DNA-3-methyladenine glycosylase
MNDLAQLPLRHIRRAELPIPTIDLARYLIGKIIVRELPTGRLTGRIVESEAYPPLDRAAHHFRGPTPRNRSMFLRRGHAYVYFSYGNHFMLNITAELPKVGGGVLIRALEPLEGIPQMQTNRKTTRLLDLTRGPGRLAAALQIDRSLDGIDLCAARPGPLWLATASNENSRVSPAGSELNRASGQGFGRAAERGNLSSSGQGFSRAAKPIANLGASAPETLSIIAASPRIGITKAAHELFRFYERGNHFVSGPARLNTAHHLKREKTPR